ncbi:methylmalonyl-CoA mutase family protein [Nocardioides sp. AN3]
MTDDSMPTAAHLQLAQPEDDHGSAAWEAAAAAVLRKSRRLGDDDADSRVWEKLARTTLDGISVTPLGTPADLDGLSTAGRPTRLGAWDVRALVADPDVKAANEAALADLDGGVTSLWVHADAEADLAALLDGVLLDLAPVVLDAPTAPVQAARGLLAVIAGRDEAPHPATNLGVDPIGAVHRGLRAEDDWADDLVAVARLAEASGVLGVVVDATAAHDLGASDGQELGYALAVGAAYLRALAAAGFGVSDAARLIEFRFAATDDQFASIAKLRAARRLWARVLELSGADAPMRLHAVTSRPMLSKYDPYVNMLRVTVAAFAAGVGGADAVTVLPFDSANGRPEAFGRRIARNVNHLLIDESHVAKVTDPAGGAYAVERLTDDLAAAGWAELGEIETSGFDTFRGRIETIVERREAEIARRKRPITGLSEFPDLTEVLPERQADPLSDAVRRYGASFEALRDDPPPQRVFLATLGPVAQHTARATFASNLLAAGGIAVDVAGATADVDELLAAYGGQSVVCLAGADSVYEQWGAEAATALREAGARHVIIAGKPAGPGDWPSCDDSAAMGVDALDFLHRTREALA